MILYNSRLEQIINDIVAYGLKHGVLLDSNEFKELLTQQLQNSDLDKPNFSFQLQDDSYTLSQYNQTKELLESDFKVLFEAIVFIYKKLRENIEKYKSLKIHRENQIEKLNKSLHEIIAQYMPGDAYASFEDPLVSSDYIDQQSSVVLDCAKREITLVKNIQSSVPLKKPRVFYMAKGSVTEVEILKQFEQSTGSLFAYVDLPKQQRLRITIEYEFEKPEFIGTLDLGLSYLKTQSISIEIDNYEFISEDVISKKTIEVNNYVQKLAIAFDRTEADQRQGEMYRYFCGIDYLTNTVFHYTNAGSITTKAINLKANTEAFSVNVDQFVPEQTGIEYSYSFDNKYWNRLTPNEKYFVANTTQKKEKCHNTNVLYKGKNFGIAPLYILKDDAANMHEHYFTRIYRYYNQWHVTNYQIMRDENLIQSFSPSKLMQSIEKGDAVECKESIECEQNIAYDVSSKLGEIHLTSVLDPHFALDQPIICKLATYIEVSQTESLTFTLQNLPVGVKCYTFINGKELKKNLEYLVRQGWNLVEVYLVFATEASRVPETWDRFIYLGLPDKSLLTNIMGDRQALQERSIESMRFSNKIDRSIAYAIDDGVIVIANNNPNICYHIVKEVADETSKQLYLKASMTSNRQSATPKIYGYKVHEF